MYLELFQQFQTIRTVSKCLTEHTGWMDDFVGCRSAVELYVAVNAMVVGSNSSWDSKLFSFPRSLRKIRRDVVCSTLYAILPNILIILPKVGNETS